MCRYHCVRPTPTALHWMFCSLDGSSSDDDNDDGGGGGSSEGGGGGVMLLIPCMRDAGGRRSSV